MLRHRPLWYKFTRQKPIWWFIVDFYCAKLYLVVEIDWKIHNSQKEYDEQRSEYLMANKMNIVRYKNEEILYTPNKTYKELLECIKDIEKNFLQVPLWRGI